MIVLRGGKLQARTQVFFFKERVIGQNLRPARAVSKQLQNIHHPQSVTTDTGPSTASAGLDGDSAKTSVYEADCGGFMLLGKFAVVFRHCARMTTGMDFA
jgi:hypothetical protein